MKIATAQFEMHHGPSMWPQIDTLSNEAMEPWPPRVFRPVGQPMEHSNQPVCIKARPCTANVNLLPHQRAQLPMLPHLRHDQQMPVVTLGNDQGHGWDHQIV